MAVISNASARAAISSCAAGTTATIIVAMAATYMADHYHVPVMVFALLLGMALNALSVEPKYAPGINFSARSLLRISVALLGLRITYMQVGSLGAATVGMVVAAVSLTIFFGWITARLFKLNARFGLLSGGSVAICGASAAIAIACAWPRKDSERDTVVVIACITAISTVAMVLYPVLTAHMGLDAVAAGKFLGGSIHDVAQVVGAGYSVSPTAGDVATVVKLMRVAMLLPLVFLIAWSYSRRSREQEAGSAKVTAVPGFLIAFVLLAVVNSFSLAPKPAVNLLNEVSHWLLVISVAALGMKTSAQEILKVGGSAVALVMAETIFLSLFVALWIHFVG